MDTKSRDVRFEAKLRDGENCRFCGAKGNTVITIKHIKAGGVWELTNAAVACTDCEKASWRKSCDTFDLKLAFIRSFRDLPTDP